jgi:PKD repeat protein
LLILFILFVYLLSVSHFYVARNENKIIYFMLRIIRCIALTCCILFCLQSYATITVNFGVTMRGGCNFFSQFVDTVTSGSGSIVWRKWILLKDSGAVQTVKKIDYSTVGSKFFSTADSGTYDIKEIYVTSAGDTDSVVKPHIIVVNASIQTRVALSSTDSVYKCTPATITVYNNSDTALGASHHFRWSVSGGGSTQTYYTTLRSTPLTLTFDNKGTYTISLFNNDSTCIPKNVVVPDLIKIDTFPTISFYVNDSTPCAIPANLLFTNTTISSGTVGAGTYNWIFGDGGTSTQDTVMHVYNALDSFTVKLIAHSALGGCTDTLTKTKYIKIPTNKDFGLTISPSTNICAGQSITLNDTAATTIGRICYDGLGHSKSSTVDTGLTFQFATPGTYTLKDSVFNSGTCSEYKYYTITVHALPAGYFTANNPYYCAPPDTVTFTVVDSLGTPYKAAGAQPYHYKWAFGDGTAAADSSTLPSPSHVYTTSGLDSVYLFITDSLGCTDTLKNGVQRGDPNYNLSMIKIAPPVLYILTSVDSGCLPLRFGYNTVLLNGTSFISTYTIDSVFIGHDSIHVAPPLFDTATLYTTTASGWDTLNFIYHLPPSLGGCRETAIDTIKGGIYHATYSTGIGPIVSCLPLDTIVCPNTKVNLTSSNCSNCSSFRWFYNPTTNLPPFVQLRNTADTFVKYFTPGKHYIMGVSNVGGCTDTTRDTLRVLPPGAPNASVTQPLCSNSYRFTLHSSVVTVTSSGSLFPPFSPTAPAVYYKWYFGDGDSTSGATNDTVETYGYANLNNANYTAAIVDSINIVVYGDTMRCSNITTVNVHATPIVDSFIVPLVDSTICAGKTITVTGPKPDYGTAYVSYTWNWGDGTTTSQSGITAMHTYTNIGIYSDTLTVKNVYGCTSTIWADLSNTVVSSSSSQSTGSIKVGGPIPHLTALNPVFACSPISVSFADSTTDSFFTITKHRWSLTGVNYSAGSLNPDTTMNFPEGIYKVYLIDSDNVKCVAKDTMLVQSLKQHAAAFIDHPGVASCVGVPVQFRDTANHFVHYLWSFGDGKTDTVANPAHIYTAPGAYTAKLKIQTIPGGAYPAGCVDSIILQDTIYIETVHASFTLSDTSITCPPVFLIANNTSTSSDSSGNNLAQFTYNWIISPPGDTAYSTNDLSPFYGVIFTPGRYVSIILSITNPWGCSSTYKDSIRVKGPRGHIEFGKRGCLPYTDTFQFVNENPTDPIADSAVWHTGDGPDSVVTNIYAPFYHTFDVVGTYRPFFLISDANCSNVLIPGDTTAAAMHNVDSIVVEKMFLQITAPTTICKGNSATMTVRDTIDAPFTYVWSPNIALSCDTCMSTVASPTTTTIYSVAVTNAIGCYNWITDTVRVDSTLVLNLHASNSSICRGQGDTLTASGTAGHYNWSPVAELSDSVGSMVIANTNVIDTYMVTLTDTFGCVKHDTISFAIKQLPQLIVPATVPIVCDSNTFSFRDSSTILPATYRWKRFASYGIMEGADSGTANISERLYDTLKHGVTVTYVFTVTANGCSNNDTLNAIVMPKLVLSNKKLSDSICSGQLFVDTAVTPNPGATLSWVRDTVSGILPYSNSDTTAFVSEALTDTALGVATYNFTISDSGCTNTANILLTVKPLPVLAKASPRSISPVCDSGLVSYIAQVTPANSKVKWGRDTVLGIWNHVVTDTGKVISEHLLNTTDTVINVAYVFTVTAGGCYSDTNTVSVQVLPKPLFNTYRDTSLCSGGTLIYHPGSNVGNLVSYTWKRVDTNGANIVISNNSSAADSLHETVSSTATGALYLQYLYTFVMNANNTCKDSAKLSVKVTPQATKPVILSDSSLSSICAGTLYHNFGTVNRPAVGESYTWSASNAVVWKMGITGQYALINFVQHNVAAVVKVTSSENGIGCLSSSDSVTIDLGSGTAPDTSALHITQLEGDVFVTNNQEDSYLWGFDSIGTLQPTKLYWENSQNFYNPPTTASRVAYWVQTSKNGCIQKTYYGLDWLDVDVVHAGDLNLMKVFPNPAGNSINVQINEPLRQESTLALYNLVGQKLAAVNVGSNTTIFDLAGLPAGSYLVIYYTGGLKRSEALFIKN